MTQLNQVDSEEMKSNENIAVKSPLISILVPVYNEANILEENLNL